MLNELLLSITNSSRLRQGTRTVNRHPAGLLRSIRFQTASKTEKGVNEVTGQGKRGESSRIDRLQFWRWDVWTVWGSHINASSLSVFTCLYFSLPPLLSLPCLTCPLSASAVGDHQTERQSATCVLIQPDCKRYSDHHFFSSKIPTHLDYLEPWKYDREENHNFKNGDWMTV